MANAEVRVAIVGDNSSLQSALNESQSKLGSWGAAVGKIALAAGVAAAGGLAVLGKASVDAASLAQQSIGATETVFGKYADTVVTQSKRAATALGLSADEYRNNANVLGALLGNQGVAQDKLAGKTQNLVKMGADLAATFGGTTTDAVNALASAFKGEFDPLEQYGISIKQSAINTEAMKVAGVETTAAFNDLSTAQQNAAKQQATTNLLTKQASKSQGAFAKETDTLAHQQQVLGAQWENLKARLGTALLPAVTDFVKLLNNEAVPAVSQLARDHLPALRDALSNLFDGDPGAKAKALGDGLSDVNWGELGTSIGELAGTVGELGPALADISVDTVNDSLSVFSELVGFAADHVDELRAVLPFIVAGFVALKAAQAANAIAGRDSVVGMLVQWATMRKLDQATKSLTLAVRELQVAQGTTAAGITATGTAAAGATSKMSKLGIAANGAAGVAGLGLLAHGATTTNESLGDLETAAGAVATGFAIGGPWGAAIGGAVALVQQFVGANNDLSSSLDALDVAKASGDLGEYGDAVSKAQAELDAFRAKSDEVSALDGLPFGLGVFGQMDRMRSKFDELRGANDESQAAIDRATKTLAAMKDGSYATTFSLGGMAFAIERNAAAAREEADALDDATNAMRDKRSEAQRGLNAQLDYQAAIDDTTQAVKDNGKTVDKGTEAGRANLRTLYSQAAAWNDQTDAVKNAKGSLAGARKSFVDAATSMGMSEGAAKRLANQLLEIKPRNVKVGVDGVAAATQQVRTLKEIIEQTKSKDIYINLHYQTIGNKPKAPTPGGDVPREAAPRSLAERKADAYNEGQRVGESYARGVAAKLNKAGRKLLDQLFGDGKGAAAGLAAIVGGIDAAANMIERVTSKRIKDDKKAAKAQARIVEALKAQGKELRANGKAQDENTAKLKDAADKVAAYAAAIKSSFVSFGDITQLGQTSTGKVTLAKLLRDLEQRAAQAEQFNQLLQQLAAAGLDQTQIEQLTAAGPEAALATAQAIASGGALAIQQVNTLSRSIATSGGVLGAALADRFAIAGQKSASSYITTLEGEQARLDKTAKKMAKAYVDELQAQLASVGGKGKGDGNGDGGGNGGHKRQLTRQALDNGGRQAVRVHLSAQQRSALERGREIQLDLDTYRAAGGRSRR